MKNTIEDIPHTRLNLLTGEKILVSPHRSKRPWQGQVEDLPTDTRPSYDPTCYLCPGNQRADGSMNPDYSESFVFVNDFSALLENTLPERTEDSGLLVAETERGICKVIAFTPRHDLTLPEMAIGEITKVVDVWQREFIELAAKDWIKYIQIFENKGAIMGCSNPHPHGQIWAESNLPMEIIKEDQRQRAHFQKNGTTLLSDYLALELQKKERLIIENEHFAVVVPFWAAWPYETLVIAKRAVADIAEFTEPEKTDLAKTLQELTIRYDNIFQLRFRIRQACTKRPSIVDRRNTGIGICIFIRLYCDRLPLKNLWWVTKCWPIRSGISRQRKLRKLSEINPQNTTKVNNK